MPRARYFNLCLKHLLLTTTTKHKSQTQENVHRSQRQLMVTISTTSLYMTRHIQSDTMVEQGRDQLHLSLERGLEASIPSRGVGTVRDGQCGAHQDHPLYDT